MNLSEHFTLEELAHSDTAVRLGIDNTPPAEVIAHLRDLAAGLEQVRRAIGFPLHINSGFRCEGLERILTAKDFLAWCNRHGKDANTAWPEYFARKTHPQGYAADVTCAQFGTPAQIVKLIRGAGIKFDQLIEEGTWVHISFDARMRGEVLTATFKDGTPSYAHA